MFFVSLADGLAEFLQDFHFAAFETGALEAQFVESLLVGSLGVFVFGFFAVATENLPFDAAEVVNLDLLMTGFGRPSGTECGAVAVVFLLALSFDENGFDGIETVLERVL